MTEIIQENKNKLSILVLSCDKYADLWSQFFECFFKFWPDCEYPVYLGANLTALEDKKVKIILSGEDKDWSSSLRKIINQIDSDYIFITLEDLFLIKKVDSEMFRKYFNILIKNKFNHCHVNPSQKIDSMIEEGVGILGKGRPYRVNVLGLWRKDYLLKMLIDGENPWNFEIMGSYRSSYDDGFYSLQNNIFETINMVEKGKWCPDKLKILRKNGIKIDSSKRKVISGTYLLRSKLQIIIVKLINSIPWKKRVKLMNVLRKILFSY